MIGKTIGTNIVFNHGPLELKIELAILKNSWIAFVEPSWIKGSHQIVYTRASTLFKYLKKHIKNNDLNTFNKMVEFYIVTWAWIVECETP